MRAQRGHRSAVAQRAGSGRHTSIVTFLTLGLLACALGRGGASPPDTFDDLYRRGQQKNGALRTLTAVFTETTTSTLLARPLTARGTLAVERPDRVALRYAEPDAHVVMIDGDRMTVSWPSRGVHRTRDIGAAQTRVQKYFVDGSPGDLRSHFQIDAREAEDRPGYVVTMLPRRRQIKSGLTRLELWIDPVSLLMTSMRMTFPNGDTKLMTFSEVKTNVPVDPSWFR
jgi:outer membrane lipoprotein-sorting protein